MAWSYRVIKAQEAADHKAVLALEVRAGGADHDGQGRRTFHELRTGHQADTEGLKGVPLRQRVPDRNGDLLVGVNNLFDRQPSLVESSFENAYDRRLADIRGRMLFVSLAKEF